MTLRARLSLCLAVLTGRVDDLLTMNREDRRELPRRLSRRERRAAARVAGAGLGHPGGRL